MALLWTFLALVGANGPAFAVDTLAGPDNRIWIADTQRVGLGNGGLWRVDPATTLSSFYDLKVVDANVAFQCLATDGTDVFTVDTNVIGGHFTLIKCTPAGVVTSVTLSNDVGPTNERPRTFIFGPDGNIWAIDVDQVVGPVHFCKIVPSTGVCTWYLASGTTGFSNAAANCIGTDGVSIWLGLTLFTFPTIFTGFVSSYTTGGVLNWSTASLTGIVDPPAMVWDGSDMWVVSNASPVAAVSATGGVTLYTTGVSASCYPVRGAYDGLVYFALNGGSNTGIIRLPPANPTASSVDLFGSPGEPLFSPAYDVFTNTLWVASEYRAGPPPIGGGVWYNPSQRRLVMLP